jgi:hypothetical protein
MTARAVLLIDCYTRGIRLLPAADSGLTIDAPQDDVTPDLIERLKAQKSGLLSILASEPVPPEARREVYAAMTERVNAGYRGGQIDWPTLDAIQRRILSAETIAELMTAAAEYECTALCWTQRPASNTM